MWTGCAGPEWVWREAVGGPDTCIRVPRTRGKKVICHNLLRFAPGYKYPGHPRTIRNRTYYCSARNQQTIKAVKAIAPPVGGGI